MYEATAAFVQIQSTSAYEHLTTSWGVDLVINFTTAPFGTDNFRL
jgi:hypothetical protein